jgi:glucosamine-6-phosphate deaminase
MMRERPERLPVVVTETYEEVAGLVAQRIAEIIRACRQERRAAVLGLATGSTPVGIYRELIRMHRSEGLDFSGVVTFNLDEYYPMAPDRLQSYHRFMRENLLDHVNIDPRNVHIPSGDLPRSEVAGHAVAYERAIVDAGGIDFQILGIGHTGHIGFNEPGSSVDSRTRLVILDTITRRVAAADFFGVENVPAEAITVGVATILEAREIALVATGENKAAVVKRAIEGEIDRGIPASYLQKHSHAIVYLDGAAAAELTRRRTPWLVREIEWTRARKIEAVVWLAENVGKSILKLEDVDYRKHGLSALLTIHGSAATLNGIVFNALTDKVRGRSKLPRGKRIVVFSPHPDDDVISAGGVLWKLSQNDNDLLVAYQTSGDLAVFDHEVRRYLEFLRRMQEDFGFGTDRLERWIGEVNGLLAARLPGQVDDAAVRLLKRRIRETEAVSALQTLRMRADQLDSSIFPFIARAWCRSSPEARRTWPSSIVSSRSAGRRSFS